MKMDRKQYENGMVQAVGDRQRSLKSSAVTHGEVRIVVVDDDPIFVRRIEKIAGNVGVSVSSCVSPAELFLKMEFYQYDVVILDYFLDDGELDGGQIAHQISHTPVIIVSQKVGFESDVYHNWPQSVRAFIDKRSGVTSIVRVAREIADRNRLMNR